MAILLGAATALARMKDRLPGTVKVIFQPTEEGLPPGEIGGAEQMVKEGVLANPRVDAIFGLHVMPYPVGTITDRGPDAGECRSVPDHDQGQSDARSVTGKSRARGSSINFSLGNCPHQEAPLSRFRSR